MKEYILKGDPAEIEKIIRENRIRVSRGEVTFTPAEPGAGLEPCCEQTLVESLVNGLTVPDDLATRLVPFGIIVPNNPETDTTDAMDDKHIEVEDLQEVDLDADDKTPVINDAKDVPADDSKEAVAAKKTSKRSKKSE